MPPTEKKTRSSKKASPQANLTEKPPETRLVRVDATIKVTAQLEVPKGLDSKKAEARCLALIDGAIAQAKTEGLAFSREDALLLDPSAPKTNNEES